MGVDSVDCDGDDDGADSGGFFDPEGCSDPSGELEVKIARSGLANYLQNFRHYVEFPNYRSP